MPTHSSITLTDDERHAAYLATETGCFFKVETYDSFNNSDNSLAAAATYSITSDKDRITAAITKGSAMSVVKTNLKKVDPRFV